MAELQALLFDVDGTLADTERDGHRVAFNRAFAEAGLDWDWDVPLYGKLLKVTGGKERIRFFLDEFNRDFARPAGFDDFVAGLHKAKTRFYTAMLDEGAIPLRPGVLRILEEARAAGMRMAVATTTTPENVTALLRSTLGADGESWFELIAAGDIVPAKKPAPDIYVWAMEKMGLKPEQCAAFEDSDNGVKSVLAAGIRTLVVTVNDYTASQNFDGSTLVVDQLEAPMQVLAGDAGGAQRVDITLVRRLHDAVNG